MRKITAADFATPAVAPLAGAFLAALGEGRTPSWPGWALDPAATGSLPDAVELEALMWSRLDVYEIPYRKSAALLGALRAILEARRPLEGAEESFLSCCDRLTHSVSPHLDTVWRDPRSFHWVLRFHQILGACLSGEELAGAARKYAEALGCASAREALVAHLARFALFTAGVVRLEDGDLWLPEPLTLELPLVIPGCDGCLEGTGPVKLRGVSRGKLILESGPGAEPPVLRPSPRAESGTLRLPLEPRLFTVPGLGFVTPSLEAGLSFQERHRPLVAETLGWIRRHAPWAHDAIGEAIRAIGVKPLGAGSYEDYSEPELPGSFVASVVERPMELADHFIHELQHNKLSCLEELSSLFDDSEAGDGKTQRLYSPWREDLRPPYGSFHGVHVNTGLCRYWIEVWRQGDLGEKDRAYVLDRLIRLPVQLSCAIHIIGTRVRLSVMGRMILDQLAGGLASLEREIAPFELPHDGPAMKVAEDGSYRPEIGRKHGRPMTVREALEDHRVTCDPNGDCPLPGRIP